MYHCTWISVPMSAKMTGSSMIHIFLKMVATGLSWPQPDFRHSIEATKARIMVARPPAPWETTKKVDQNFLLK